MIDTEQEEDIVTNNNSEPTNMIGRRSNDMLKNNKFTFEFASDRKLTHEENMEICRIAHGYLRDVVRDVVRDNSCDHNSSFGFVENK